MCASAKSKASGPPLERDLKIDEDKNHDEYLEVTEGKIEITAAGKTKIVTSGDGPFYVPRLTVHGFKCLPGVRSTLREKTVPSGDFKELYVDPQLVDVGCHED